MEDFSSIEAMLFGLKDVVKDSDAVSLKKDIDFHIEVVSDNKGDFEPQKEIDFIATTVSEVSVSFKKREKQMLTDLEIVRKIDSKIDRFRDEQNTKMQGLIDSLLRDVDEAVDEYAGTIIRELDPKKIKDRFNKKDDFELWLTTINTHYKEKMEATVDRRTQSTLRSYLIEVEGVFDTAISYLADREESITIEDQFYGSLADSKSLITRDTRNSIKSLVGYNKSLYEASENLFNEIWEARQKYDEKRFATTATATTVGGVATGVATGFATKAVFTAAGLTGAAPALGIIAGIGLLVISGIIISQVALKLSSSLYSTSFEKDVRNCVDGFLEEINKSKLAMQAYLSDSIKLVFENELKSLDRTFLDFRTVTYIDESKIPKLAEKIKAIENSIESEAV